MFAIDFINLQMNRFNCNLIDYFIFQRTIKRGIMEEHKNEILFHLYMVNIKKGCTDQFSKKCTTFKSTLIPKTEKVFLENTLLKVT